MKSFEPTKSSNQISLTARVYMLRVFMSTAIACCLFFLGAGNWSEYRGWLYFGTAAIAVFLSNLIVAKANPGLLEQRSKFRKGSKKWDKIWLFTFMLFFMYGMPLIAGYDIGRLNNQTGYWTIYPGLALYLFSAFLVTWAMSVNKFFETTVRIQHDRGHYVITSGPYRYIRHPGYSALIFYAIGFPLIVGSIMALYVGIVLLMGLALRTHLEDNILRKELNGYEDYARNVRYRWVPYIW